MTTTPRRPADIASGLTDLADALAEGATLGDLPAGWNGTLALLHDAANALSRWPTADEIGELKGDANELNAIAIQVEARMDSRDAYELRQVAERLGRFLDRLDPPAPEPQADDAAAKLLLSGLASEMRRNSERWFPNLHTSGQPPEVFYALGLAGETGEAVGEVKKALRHGVRASTRPGLGPELSDVFVYLLLLVEETGVDLLAEYRAKVRENEARWGGQPEPQADDDVDWRASGG